MTPTVEEASIILIKEYKAGKKDWTREDVSILFTIIKAYAKEREMLKEEILRCDKLDD